MAVSLQQLVPLFSLSNLDEIGNPRSVLESAHQDDSKTPPGSQNWPRFDRVIEATKLCSLIFSSTRSIHDFFGNQLLHQILVNFGFQGVFWNRLDEQILKLTLDFQWDQDLAEKTCCWKLTDPYCKSTNRFQFSVKSISYLVSPLASKYLQDVMMLQR